MLSVCTYVGLQCVQKSYLMAGLYAQEWRGKGEVEKRARTSIAVCTNMDLEFGGCQL